MLGYCTTPEIFVEVANMLEMFCDGNLYVDTVLMLGYCTTPKIFVEVANMLEWVVKKMGIMQFTIT